MTTKGENLEQLTLAQLCDLLAENTLQLLESIGNKADGITIRDQKKRVEAIQQIIREKRARAEGNQ